MARDGSRPDDETRYHGLRDSAAKAPRRLGSAAFPGFRWTIGDAVARPFRRAKADRNRRGHADVDVLLMLPTLI